MKKLLFLLLLIPTVTFSQTDSWVNFKVQYDFYAPSESNFFMVEDTINGDTAIFHQPTTAYQYLDTTIYINSGDYVITLNDSYGDGWISQNPAYFKMSNTCQGLIIDWDPVLGSFYLRDTTVSILPCAPPTSGCTDPLALNYDSTAAIDDGSCLYIMGCTDPIAENYDSTATQDDGSCTYIIGCMNTNASNYDSTATQAWYQGTVVPGGSCNTNIWGGNYFGIDSAYYWANDSIIDVGTRFWVAGTWYWIDAIDFPTNCNAPAVLIYASNDENTCDGNPWTFTPGITLDAVVGNSWYISPCTYIYGCTDSLAINYNDSAGVDNGTCLFVTGCTDTTAVNYNPAATQDDGSCIGGGITCSPGKQKVTVQITLDQYAGETGWLLTGPTGILAEVLTGGYAGYPTGAIVEQEICIDFNTEVTFTINDSYGDGLGGSNYGGIDGSWIVYTACDTISIGGGDFGYSYTETDTIWECDMNPVPGCTDPLYQEYNPMANTDDGSCNNLHIWGCTDSNAFNYDPIATSMQQNPGCGNTLILTDWAGDGWFGSFLYVTQGTNSFGPFTVQTDSFVTNIPLTTSEPVKVWFYSFGQSQTTSDQCAFAILNPLGNVILSAGSNPYIDPILSYNQYQHYYSGAALCGNVCIDRVYGCIDSLAVNYNPLANTTDGSCYYSPGCTDPAYEQYHTQGFVADYDDGSCTTYAIFGCMDSTQFNYDPYATVQWTSVVDQTNPCIARVFGCLDPTAFNYDPLANTEDYSCIPFIYGCMDMTMWNYDPLANTDNGSCIPFIFGCTDSTALNFDPLANTNDGSCIPYLYGCTDSLAINFNPLANTDDGSCIAELLGCTDSTALNYNSLANTDDGSCIPYIYGCTDSLAFNYSLTANTDDGSCIPFIYGCMDATMWNYDPLANSPDTCIAYVYGCTDPTAWNYDSLANTNVGCISFVYGCTDPTAFNYNPQANTDDSTCVPVVIGCTDPTALNYDSLANTNSGCIYPILGCTDPLAYNYDPNANTDDGSCVPVIIGCTDATALNYDSLANTNNGCIYPVLGCTDPNAFNYDPTANVDDSTCVPFIYGCTDPTMWNYDATANTDNGSCLPFVYGCTDSTQFNYDPTANTDNGTCIPFIYGCTDLTALNFDPLANSLDNSCCYIGGCTDSTALNYDPNACSDDGSCITIVIGCTDVGAFNYNPAANVSDSTACLYDAGCITGPGNPYWLNDGCYAWVIDIDDYCCSNSWDPFCQDLYDYCQLGWPTSISESEGNSITVYPNPTKDILNIDSRVALDVEVHDMMGKLVISEKEARKIDLSGIIPGVYNISIIYDKYRFSKRVVKQ